MTAKEKIHLDSKDAFQVKAKKVVQIQVGSYAIEIKTDAIKIGKGSDGKPQDPMITIKGQTITLDSSGMGVEINKSTREDGQGWQHRRGSTGAATSRSRPRRCCWGECFERGELSGLWRRADAGPLHGLWRGGPAWGAIRFSG